MKKLSKKKQQPTCMEKADTASTTIMRVGQKMNDAGKQGRSRVKFLTEGKAVTYSRDSRQSCDLLQGQ